mgnify:CR=1 FL=1
MFDTIIPSTGLDMTSSLICTGVSIALGALSAFLYRLGKKRCSNSLTITLVVLPAMVQTVIMLVNGSVGAGLAVMGAFSLVRFRSTPGNARDICFIFYSMCIGLATGMGYIAFAVLLAITVGIVLAVLGLIPRFRDVQRRKILRITIPEDMNYTFDEFLSSSELVMVKSTAMGTLFDLRYEIVEKDAAREKELIDKLRTRNGNLTISIGLAPDSCESL